MTLNMGGQNLLERAAKESILIDYFTFIDEEDLKDSPMWQSFSEEQQNNILQQFEQNNPFKYK